MASEQHGPSTRRRNQLIAAALVMWIVVVVAGAGDTSDDSLLGVEHLEMVWFVVWGLMALAGLALVFMLKPFTTTWVTPKKRKRSSAGLTMLLVLVLLVWNPDLVNRLVDRVQPPQPAGDVLAGDVLPEELETAPETVAQLSDLLLLLAAIGALAAVWLVLSRRRRQPADPAESRAATEALEADLLVALEQLISELGSSDDPRMAVLASYAMLETVLADHGLRRLRSETPTEHLRRSLTDLQVDADPIVRLGELYEIARFSDHPITTREQLDAATSLERARAAFSSRT